MLWLLFPRNVDLPSRLPGRMGESALSVGFLRFFVERGEVAPSFAMGLEFRGLPVSTGECCGSRPWLGNRIGVSDWSEGQTGSQSIQWSHSLFGAEFCTSALVVFMLAKP